MTKLRVGHFVVQKQVCIFPSPKQMGILFKGKPYLNKCGSRSFRLQSVVHCIDLLSVLQISFIFSLFYIIIFTCVYVTLYLKLLSTVLCTPVWNTLVIDSHQCTAILQLSINVSVIDGWTVGYLKILYELQKLFSVKWYEWMIAFGNFKGFLGGSSHISRHCTSIHLKELKKATRNLP